MKYRDRFKMGSWWSLLIVILADASVPFVPVLEAVLLVALFWPTVGRFFSWWFRRALEGK